LPRGKERLRPSLKFSEVEQLEFERLEFDELEFGQFGNRKPGISEGMNQSDS